MPGIKTATRFPQQVSTGVQSELQVSEIGSGETRDLTFSFPPKLFLTSCAPQRRPLGVSFSVSHHGYGGYDRTEQCNAVYARGRLADNGVGATSNNRMWAYAAWSLGDYSIVVAGSTPSADTLRLSASGPDSRDRFVPVLALGNDIVGKVGTFDLGPGARIDCGFRPTALIIFNTSPWKLDVQPIPTAPYSNMLLFADRPGSGISSAKVGDARSTTGFTVWHESQAGGYASSGNSSYDVNATFDATGVDLAVLYKDGFPTTFLPLLSMYVAIGGVDCDLVVADSPGAPGQQTIATALQSVGAAVVIGCKNPLGVIKGSATESQWGYSIGHVASNAQYGTYTSVMNTHGQEGAAVVKTLDDQPTETPVTYLKRGVASFSGSDVVLDWSADDSAGAVFVLAMEGGGGTAPQTPKTEPWLYHLPV